MVRHQIFPKKLERKPNYPEFVVLQLQSRQIMQLMSDSSLIMKPESSQAANSAGFSLSKSPKAIFAIN